MPSLSAKDRVSLCSFTFADGRRCRSPRFANHPRFCPDHAEKESRARARQNLGKDLAHYFSGHYLSACDLSTALGCLIPAVIRGDVKPRTARTVAYLAQTLMQSIHMAKHEYINAFDTDGWRNSIRNSVNGNHNYRFPFAPSEAEGPATTPEPPPNQAPVVAGLPRSQRPGSTGKTGEGPAPQPAQPASFFAHTHSSVRHPERSEGSQPIHVTQPSPVAQGVYPEGLPSSSNSLATHHSFTPTEAEGPLPPASQPTPSPQTPLPSTGAEFARLLLAGLPRPDSTAETGEPQTPQHTLPQPAPPTSSTSQPTCPDQAPTVDPPPAHRSHEPSRDTPWWDSGHLYDPPDSHLL